MAWYYINLPYRQSLLSFVRKFNAALIHIRAYLTSVSQKMLVEMSGNSFYVGGTWRVSDGRGPTDLGDSEAQLGRTP